MGWSYVVNQILKTADAAVKASVDALYARMADGSQVSQEKPYGAIVGQGMKAVPTGTAEPLGPSTPCRTITVRSDNGANANGNKGVIWIGGPGVSTTGGIPLRPGESFTLSIGDVAAVYCVSGIAGQTLTWMAAL